MCRIEYFYFAGRNQMFNAIFNLPQIALLFSSIKIAGKRMSRGRNCRSGRGTDKIEFIREPSVERMY